MDECAELALSSLGIDVRDVLWGNATDKLANTRYLQPALFVLEYALARAWLARGVRPTTVLGHSIGEYAAACVAEIFSLQDALKLVCARGQLMDQLTTPGEMIAALAARSTVEPLIKDAGDDLAVAAENSPGNTVIAGGAGSVARVRAALEQRGIKVIPLDVARAFHSPLMEPMLQAFAAVARTVRYSRPKIAFVSTVTGTKLSAELTSADYWVRQIAATVCFASAAREALRKKDSVLLEIGPGSTLVALATETLASEQRICVPTLTRGAAATGSFKRAIATLYEHGVDIDWLALARQEGPGRRTSLPVYPFDRRRFWPVRQAASSTTALGL